MKRFISLTLGLLLLLLTTTPLLSAEAEPKITYKAGTYQGSGRGQKGEVVVETEFSDDAILNVRIVSEGETVRVAAPALERIPAAIVAKQSLAVDTISSCTMTSLAIINAVANCVEQAGGDVAALRAPLRKAPKAADATIDVDVVVVGGGLAGLTAAISALDEGASVALFEKNDVAGGSSKLSGGFITAIGTDLQKSLGVEDSVDDYMAYWDASMAQSAREDKTDHEAVRAMLERSADDVDWLIAHNIGLQAPTGFGGPMPRWHFSDWRKDFMDGAVAGGVDHIVRAVDFLEGKEGMTFYYSTPVTELITDANGNVVGAKATAEDGSIITANAKSVVLATGGWARSVELMQRFCPEFPSDWVLPYTASSVGTTGDGIIMAEAVGADLYDGWWMDLAVMFQPGSFESELNGLQRSAMHYYTDGTGERLFNSSGLFGVRSLRMTQAYRETGAVWTVFDLNLPDAAQIVDKYIDNSAAYKADSLEELAGMIGVDKDVFLASIERYNGMVAAGVDTDMGQTNLVAIDKGPFYALSSKICTMGTLGGLKTDANCQVLGKDGQPIANLFAAGEVMNGKYFNQVYISGCAQLLCVDSGRIAGASAAKAA